MSDLVAFLRERLDEDEGIAQYCQEASLSQAVKTMSGDDRLKLFLVRHDPARVLREVDAKRKILADPYEYTSRPDELLRVLAAVYSDHPDYQQEWA